MCPENQVSGPAWTPHSRIICIQPHLTQLPELQRHGSAMCKSSSLFSNSCTISNRQLHCDFHQQQNCYLVYHHYQTKDQNVAVCILLASTAVQVIWSSRKPELVLGGIYNPWCGSLEADISAHALFYSPIPCKNKASTLFPFQHSFNHSPRCQRGTLFYFAKKRWEQH